jgi:hypothetical protein
VSAWEEEEYGCVCLIYLIEFLIYLFSYFLPSVVAGYIPRPANAFMLFRADFVRQKHVPGSVEASHGSLSRIIGEFSEFFFVFSRFAFVILFFLFCFFSLFRPNYFYFALLYFISICGASRQHANHHPFH